MLQLDLRYLRIELEPRHADTGLEDVVSSKLTRSEKHSRTNLQVALGSSIQPRIFIWT